MNRGQDTGPISAEIARLEVDKARLQVALARMIEILWDHLPPGGYYTEHAEIKRAEALLDRP